ncbi:MAG: TIM barrel protein [Candidatus Woesearchaeota archaeon]|nr:MAG: TIM barrel protein [Candidatus Woesearchaeota archaeon]
MWKPDKLRFGTAGIANKAHALNLDTAQAIEFNRKQLNLDAFELEFVRSINISKEKSPLIKEVSQKNDITISCHGQYWVNLNAQEEIKLKKSIGMMVDAAKRVYECGGWTITWHFAYLMKQDPVKVYQKVKEATKKVIKKLKDENIFIWIRPESNGRTAQFGQLDDLIKLSQEVEMVLPCIDYSHLHASSNGKYNTYEEFKEILARLEKGLGKEILNNMHIQAQGVEYSDKGEKRHLNIKESDCNYKDMVKSWKEFKIKGVVIPESPNIEEDALLLKKTYEKF